MPLRIPNPVGAAEHRAAAKLWSEFRPDTTGWVLDLGCGPGRFWSKIETPHRLLRMDIVRRYATVDPDVPFIAAGAEHLPIASDALDAIVSLGLLEYLPDLDAVLSECHRVVRLRGLLLASHSPPVFPNRLRRNIYGDIHLRSDAEVWRSLSTTGWIPLIPRPVHAGWQSLWAAIAV